MAQSANSLNVRMLLDVPPPTRFTCHSSELKGAFANKLRMDFLNFKGQDYFVNACSPAEEQTWLAAWKDQADIRYAQEGDYSIDLITGEETFIDLTIPIPTINCDKYSWDISEIMEGTPLTITYLDCECNVQTITGDTGSISNPFIVCSQDIPSVNLGVISYVESCIEGQQSYY